MDERGGIFYSNALLMQRPPLINPGRTNTCKMTNEVELTKVIVFFLFFYRIINFYVWL
jgi:hypothetical protein